jgi:hypothetical protein
MGVYQFADRVKDSTTTTGTGNVTLSGTAPTGFQSFNTAFGVGPIFNYVIVGSSGEWEVGIGSLSGATTLVRSTVLASSNSNALVSFSAGTKEVFCTIPADFIEQLQAITVNTQTGTTYSLVASDSGKDVRTTNAAAKTVTIDPTSTLGTDFICSVINLGAGALTFAPGSGVTLQKNVWKLGQYKRAIVIAIGTDTYLIDMDEPDEVTTLTDAATVTVDPLLSIRYRLSTANSRTIGSPGTATDGRTMTIYIENTSGSPVTPTFTTGASGNFRFNSVLTTASAIAAGKKRYWTFQYNSTDARWDVLAESGEF